MIFQTQAEISKIMTMSDHGVRLQIDTPELGPEETAKLFNLKKPETIVWVAFKDIPLEEKDIDVPEVMDKDVDTKTPSQRLRACLFLYWQQNKKGMDFPLFYQRQMEKWISSIKEKLQ